MPRIQKTGSTASTSMYFKSFPEIRQRNNRSTKTRKPVVLPNGSIPSAVKINGVSYFVYNTCPFDSIIHILMTSAIDDPSYAAFIAKSSNNTMKFVLHLTNEGVTAQTMRERVLILKSVYSAKIEMATENNVISYSINVGDSIGEVWRLLLNSEPSACQTVRCSSLCDQRISTTPTLTVNHKTITREGFSAIKKALEFNLKFFNVKCIRRGCMGNTTIERNANYHIFIELDIRKSLTAACGMKCRLQDFPTILELNVKYKCV